MNKRFSIITVSMWIMFLIIIVGLTRRMQPKTQESPPVPVAKPPFVFIPPLSQNNAVVSPHEIMFVLNNGTDIVVSTDQQVKPVLTAGQLTLTDANGKWWGFEIGNGTQQVAYWYSW